MASEPKESLANNPGLHTPPDEATRGYFVQHTKFQIKDPKVSLDFYTSVLGMSLLKRLDFPDATVYYLGYEDTESAPTDPVDRTTWTYGRLATVELVHNLGTGSDADFISGNSEYLDFVHIGIVVDDTYKACERFERLGVEFAKKPHDGEVKGLAYIKDPDGYNVEIMDLKNLRKITAAVV